MALKLSQTPMCLLPSPLNLDQNDLKAWTLRSILERAEKDTRLSERGLDGEATDKEWALTRVELVSVRCRGENWGTAVRDGEFPSCLSTSSPRTEERKEGKVADNERDMIKDIKD